MVAVLGLLSLFVAVYYYFDPSEKSFFPSCPLKTLTGYDCAGCGVQRALHAILHGNWRAAWALNPLFVLLLPVSLFYLIIIIFRKHPVMRNWYGIFFGRAITFVLIVIILVFSLFRNTAVYQAIF